MALEGSWWGAWGNKLEPRDRADLCRRLPAPSESRQMTKFSNLSERRTGSAQVLDELRAQRDHEHDLRVRAHVAGELRRLVHSERLAARDARQEADAALRELEGVRALHDLTLESVGRRRRMVQRARHVMGR